MKYSKVFKWEFNKNRIPNKIDIDILSGLFNFNSDILASLLNNIKTDKLKLYGPIELANKEKTRWENLNLYTSQFKEIEHLSWQKTIFLTEIEGNPIPVVEFIFNTMKNLQTLEFNLYSYLGYVNEMEHFEEYYMGILMCFPLMIKELKELCQFIYEKRENLRKIDLRTQIVAHTLINTSFEQKVRYYKELLKIIHNENLCFTQEPWYQVIEYLAHYKANKKSLMVNHKKLLKLHDNLFRKDFSYILKLNIGNTFRIEFEFLFS